MSSPIAAPTGLSPAIPTCAIFALSSDEPNVKSWDHGGERLTPPFTTVRSNRAEIDPVDIGNCQRDSSKGTPSPYLQPETAYPGCLPAPGKLRGEHHRRSVLHRHYGEANRRFGRQDRPNRNSLLVLTPCLPGPSPSPR
jgi:hypothetical protein